MSRYNRHDPWAEPTQTPNTTRRRVYDDDDDDDASNMQMARRPQQSSRPSQSTSQTALTHRPTERVESWRNEKRNEDLSGAMSRMRINQPSHPSRPARPHSPSPSYSPSPPRHREVPRERVPSPSPSPLPMRSRRAPSPNPFDDEPVRTRYTRRAARSPSPPPARRQRSPSPFDNPFNTPRRRARSPFFSSNPSNYSSITVSTTSTTYNGRTTTSTSRTYGGGGRMRDTYRFTRHQPGVQHNPGCPFCFETQGAAVRAAAEWNEAGEECWVEWDPHGRGLWGVVFDIGCGGGEGGEVWFS